MAKNDFKMAKNEDDKSDLIFPKLAKQTNRHLVICQNVPNENDLIGEGWLHNDVF